MLSKIVHNFIAGFLKKHIPPGESVLSFNIFKKSFLSVLPTSGAYLAEIKMSLSVATLEGISGGGVIF